MTDARLRALERAARDPDDVGAAGALLRERLRRGALDPRRLRLAAFLGDAAAHAALADSLPDAAEARASLAAMWAPGIDDAVRVAWDGLLGDLRRQALADVAPFMTAAAEEPRLRRLFPFSSESDVGFSRCAQFPFTDEVMVCRVGQAWVVHVRQHLHARVRDAKAAAAAAARAAAPPAQGEVDRWIGKRQDLPLEVARLGGPWPPRRGDALAIGLASSTFPAETALRAAAAIAAAAAADWSAAEPGETRVQACADAVAAHALAPSRGRAEACEALARPIARLAGLRERAVGLAWPEGLRLGRLARTVLLAATRLDRPKEVLRDPPGLRGGDAALRQALVDALIPWALTPSTPS